MPKLRPSLVCMRMHKGSELLYGNIHTLQYQGEKIFTLVTHAGENQTDLV